MGAIRKKLLNQSPAAHPNKSVFKKLVDAGLVEMIRNNDEEGINDTLTDILGAGYDYNSLMTL